MIYGYSTFTKPPKMDDTARNDRVLRRLLKLAGVASKENEDDPKVQSDISTNER